MNFVLATINRSRRKPNKELGHKNPDQKKAQERFLTVGQYHTLARRIIGRFAPASVKASMLNSEDAIDYIAYKIMRGDWIYDPSLNVKISSYRGMNGRLAITDYMKAHARNTKTTQSLDFNYGDGATLHHTQADPKAIEPRAIYIEREDSDELRAYVELILDTLSETQRSCVVLHYLDGLGQSEVSRILRISREAVRKSLAEAMKKLRKVVCDE